MKVLYEQCRWWWWQLRATHHFYAISNKEHVVSLFPFYFDLLNDQSVKFNVGHIGK